MSSEKTEHDGVEHNFVDQADSSIINNKCSWVYENLYKKPHSDFKAKDLIPYLFQKYEEDHGEQYQGYFLNDFSRSSILNDYSLESFLIQIIQKTGSAILSSSLFTLISNRLISTHELMRALVQHTYPAHHFEDEPIEHINSHSDHGNVSSDFDFSAKQYGAREESAARTIQRFLRRHASKLVQGNLPHGERAGRITQSALCFFNQERPCKSTDILAIRAFVEALHEKNPEQLFDMLKQDLGRFTACTISAMERGLEGKPGSITMEQGKTLLDLIQFIRELNSPESPLLNLEVTLLDEGGLAALFDSISLLGAKLVFSPIEQEEIARSIR